MERWKSGREMKCKLGGYRAHYCLVYKAIQSQNYVIIMGKTSGSLISCLLVILSAAATQFRTFTAVFVRENPNSSRDSSWTSTSPVKAISMPCELQSRLLKGGCIGDV